MTRIYKVEGPVPDQTRLVRANTPAQAVRHAVKSDYSATVAAQDDLVELLSRGVQVETAGADDEQVAA